MFRIISALLLAISSTLALAQTANRPIELAPNAPERHIVVHGDTLWGISAKFLKDPYRWPELWRMNKAEIKKPQLIYPGQVIVLDKSGATPQLRLAQQTIKLQPKEYVEMQKKEIAAIPYEAIQPFLDQPLLLGETDSATWPRIVEIEANRSVVGAGDHIYAKGVTAAQGKVWRIYRPGQPLKHPVTGETIATEGIYLGSARLTAEGNPATLEISTSTREIGRDDLLQPEGGPSIVSYAPHAPDKQVEGNVLGTYGSEGAAGKGYVISISVGKKDGMEVGHVLAARKAGRSVDTRYDGLKETWEIPGDRNGLIFIFRVFENVSYALVMDTRYPVVVGDVVRTP